MEDKCLCVPCVVYNLKANRSIFPHPHPRTYFHRQEHNSALSKLRDQEKKTFESSQNKILQKVKEENQKSLSEAKAHLEEDHGKRKKKLLEDLQKKTEEELEQLKIEFVREMQQRKEELLKEHEEVRVSFQPLRLKDS